MQYNKTNWEDRRTVVNAERMNNIEEGIHSSHEEIHSLKTKQQEDIEEVQGQLTDIKEEKGYVTTKILHDATDFNTLKTNGKYRIFNGTNAPKTGEHMFVIEVISVAGQNVSQIATLIEGQGEVYYRVCANETWGKWFKVIDNRDKQSLEQSIAQAKQELTQLITSLEETTNATISEIKQDITSIEQIVGAGGEGGSLTERVAKNEENISTLTSRTGTLETKVEELKTKDGTFDTRITALEGKVTESTSELREQLEGQIEQASTTAQTNLEQVKTELTQSISSTNQKVQENKEGLTTLKEDLTTHKTDPLAHADIREDIGVVDELMTKSKEVVGAINELYLTGGSGGSTHIASGKVVGTEKVLRVVAEGTTNTLDAKVYLDVNKVQVYLMGKRIFNEKDFTVENTVITLKSTILEGEYVDFLFMEELLIDITNNTMAETHHRYIAEEKTKTFTAEGQLRYGFLDLYIMGVRAYEDYDYTVDRESNVITLNQALEVGDYVDYSIRTNTGMDITTIQDEIEFISNNKENINKIPTIETTLNDMKPKVESTVSSVEESSNYNTIKVVKTNGETSFVKVKTMTGDGTGVKLYESGRIEDSYQATEAEETSFKLPTKLTDNSYVELYYKSLRLINGTHYTVSTDAESTTINLMFTLKQSEVINYVIKHTSYEYSDLNGTPDLSVYATNEKIKALETKDEELFGEINVLSSDKVDKNNGWATNLRINNTITTPSYYNPQNGYLIKTGLMKSTGAMVSVHLTGNIYKSGGAGVLDTYIEAYCYTGSKAPYNESILCNGYPINPKLFYLNGEFCIWIEKWSQFPTLRAEVTSGAYGGEFNPQIVDSAMPEYDEGSLSKVQVEVSAKTTKTEVLVRPKPNYTIAENRSCIINNILFLSITVTRTDNQNFNKSFGLQIGQIDASIRNIWQAIAVGNAYGTAHMMGKEIAVNITSDSNRIYLDGVFVL